MIPILKINKDSTIWVNSITGKDDDTKFALEILKDGNDSFQNLPLLTTKSHLTSADITVVDSIMAGKTREKRGDFYKDVIKPIFELLEIGKFTYFETTDKKSVEKFASNFLQKTSTDTSNGQTTVPKDRRRHIVIFLSGDTTISEFLNNLHLPSAHGIQHIDILPLPLGTANAWSSIMSGSTQANEQNKIPQNVSYAPVIQLFHNFLYNNLLPRHFPLYKINLSNDKLSPKTIYMMIIFSMGFHANLLHLTTNDPKYSTMGLERFKLASEIILEKYDLDVHLKVSEDKNKQIVVGGFAYFALINQSNLEPAYKPSPLSKPFEQSLQMLGYTSKLTKQQLVEAIMKGYNPDSKTIVDYYRATDGIVYEKIASDITIEINEKFEPNTGNLKSQICIDGYLFDYKDLNPSATTDEREAEGKDHPYKINITNNDYPWKNIVRVFTSIKE